MLTKQEINKEKHRQKLTSQVRKIFNDSKNIGPANLIKKLEEVYLFESPFELLHHLTSQGNGAMNTDQWMAGCLMLALVNMLKLKHNQIFEGIGETLEYLSNSIPSNPYNIKEVLQTIGIAIHGGDFENIDAHLGIAKVSLCRDDQTHPYIYNNDDLEHIKDQAYEEGYKAALLAAKKTKDTRDIDLAE